MPITVIRKEKNTAELAARVFELKSAEPEVVKRAEALLKAANPNVDFRRLTPGTVLVVPEHAELKLAARETAAGAAAAGLAELFRDALAAGRKRFEVGQKAEEQERDVALRLLKSNAIKTLAARDEAVKADVTRVGEALVEQAKESKQRAEALSAMFEQMQQDLDELVKRVS